MAEVGITGDPFAELEQKDEETKETIVPEEDAKLPVDEPGGEDKKEEKEPEPELEEKAEDKKEPEKAPEPVIAEELKEIFPDAKTPEDVVASTIALNNSNKEILNILGDNPLLIGILKELRDTKKPLAAVIREHLELADNELPPDPVEDPSGYREFLAKQYKKEARIKAELEEKETLTKKEQAALDAQKKEAEAQTKKALAHKAEFQKSEGLTDAQMEEFLAKAKDFLYSGVDKNWLYRVKKAINYDADLEAEKKKTAEEVKKAEVKGANKAIDQIKKNGAVKGDQLPSLHSAKTEVIVDDLTDIAESLKPRVSFLDKLK